MRRAAVGIAMVVLVGCGEETAPPPSVQTQEVSEATPPPVVPVPVGEKPAPEGEAAEPGAPCPDSPADGPRDVTIAWSDVRPSPSCFFFSGPGTLGRDDRLGGRARFELRGGRAALDFGGGVRFAGSAGAQIALTRTSDHDFQGTWRVTERITGAWRAGVERHLETPCAERPRVAHAQYRYEECDTSNPSSCPGRCTITATLTIR